MTVLKIVCAVMSIVLLLVAVPLNAAPPPKVTAFVHIVAAAGANNCGSATVINHPAANNNPNAVISVTYNAGFTSGDPNAIFFNGGPLAVYFDNATIPQCPSAAGTVSSAGRWLIYGLDSTSSSSFTAGQRFNVIVVSP